VHHCKSQLNSSAALPSWVSAGFSRCRSFRFRIQPE